MRSEEEMYTLILTTAQEDARIRAVILNGSRANPNAPRDVFQDFDVVYVVRDLPSFTSDHSWVARFGELMIMQMPDAMLSASPETLSFAYLMQFMDGNRIDLTLFPLERLDALENDSLSVLLLDKDGIIPPFPPPNERQYFPRPPTAQAFADCCNEFWWVCPYVAKGLWRAEILYARTMLDEVVRAQLMQMLTWYIGVKTQFACNPGKMGKYFQRYLEPDLWALLLQTYADASYAATWEALLTMGALFRRVAAPLAAHFGFDYPHGDDERVSAYLRHVRDWPRDAPSMLRCGVCDFM